MSNKENYYNDNKEKVDPKTNFIIGSPEYYAYYFPKKDTKDPNTKKNTHKSDREDGEDGEDGR